MIEIKIQAADLLKWGEQLDEFCKDVPIMFSSVLNKLGDSALQTSTDYLSAQTGLDGIDVRNAIQIHEATPQDLLWAMDARSVTLEPSPNWARPWQAPGDNTFNQQQLLRVVTSGDGRVCEICAAAAEKPWTVEDINAAAAKWKDFQPPYPVVGERSNLLHPNAVLEGSRFVSYGHVTEMVRAVFSADAIRAETTVRGFTIGPNHPVLTRRGFVRAHALTEGDELLYDRRCDIPGETFAVADGSRLHNDFDKVPFVEDAFATLEAAGQGSQTVVSSSNDLHGDAVFCQREVNVVRAARGLLSELDARGIEQFSELGLPFADVQLTSKSSLRTLRALLTTTLAALYGFMSARNLRLALSGGHTGPLDQFLFRSGSQHDALFLKQAIDNRATDAQALCDGINALAGFVKRSSVFRWDRVVAVGHVRFSGLAFDATTVTGLYNSDGYVVHNCRCHTVPWDASRQQGAEFAGAPSNPPVVLTGREIVETFATEVRGMLKGS